MSIKNHLLIILLSSITSISVAATMPEHISNSGTKKVKNLDTQIIRKQFTDTINPSSYLIRGSKHHSGVKVE